MSEQVFIGLILYMILAVVIGALLVCLSIEFIGDGFEPQGVSVDWSKAIIGLALLLSAGVIASVKWPV